MSKFEKKHESTLLSVIVDFIGDIIGCPPAYKTKTIQYNLEEGGIQRKKFQTHDPPSSSLDALTTERLQAGKFLIIIATLAG